RRLHTRFDCDWSSDVCSSDLGVDLARNFGERFEVDDAGHGCATRPDQLRTLALRDVPHLVVVDPTGVLAHLVLHRSEELARDRQIGRESCRESVSSYVLYV